MTAHAICSYVGVWGEDGTVLAKICSESGRTKLIYVVLETRICLIPISTGLQAFFSDLKNFLLHFLPEKILFFQSFFE